MALTSTHHVQAETPKHRKGTRTALLVRYTSAGSSIVQTCDGAMSHTLLL